MTIPIDDPRDPNWLPGGGGGSGGGSGELPPDVLPGLGGFVTSRYRSNLVISEEMPVIDLMHEVIFPASRMFISQGANGKIRMQNHKPVDWALCIESLEVGETVISVDDVSPWVGNLKYFLLIDPHTSVSEVRAVTETTYDTDANTVTLTGDALFTITGFAGATATTPAVATVVVGVPVEDDPYEIILDGYAVNLIAGADDTAETIAAFLEGTFKAHPGLRRKFSFSVTTDTLTITGRFGSLTLDTPLELAHSAPLADPTDAPVLTASSGALSAGAYRVAYTYTNSRGQTLLSPFKSITLAADEKIDVDAVTLPADATAIRWYVSNEAGSQRLRYHSENDGTAFSITTLPMLTAPLPPDLNRTGTEVMRVVAIFSDRAESRSAIVASNVIRSTFEWQLGDRKKSVNRIDVKYRDAGQDWRLIELRLRDDAHIAKIHKVENEEINGQAIDNYFQAYRIAAAELAVRRDADFFYKWKATRGALLIEEGDVVVITDDGSGVYNLPVSVEEISLDIKQASMPRASFTGQKYSTTLYDDSVVERSIPVR
jgi:hypothetical protein